MAVNEVYTVDVSLGYDLDRGGRAIIAGKWTKDRAQMEYWLRRYEQQVIAENPQRGRRFYGKFPPGTRCAYCLERTEEPARDHIEPFSKGGTDAPDNIVPACASCNSQKNARALLEFVALGGAQIERPPFPPSPLKMAPDPNELVWLFDEEVAS